MALRTLLVHADADERFAQRLSLAVEIAREHQARLLFLHVLKAPLSVGLYSEPMGAPAMELIQQEINAERERAAELHRMVERQMPQGAAWEWRSVQGVGGEAIAAGAAPTDLIVMGQPQDSAATGVVVQVALSAGRPLLCVPHTGNVTLPGRRVVVAWRATREAARALHDALPLLVRAELVVLFSATNDGVEDGSAAEAVRHLEDHGVKARLQQTALGDVDAGTAILNAVADNAADMLVMGAYGHSRLREFVFGGATRTVLRSMTVPTMISH